MSGERGEGSHREVGVKAWLLIVRVIKRYCNAHLGVAAPIAPGGIEFACGDRVFDDCEDGGPVDSACPEEEGGICGSNAE